MKFFLTIILVLFASAALAQPVEEWVARYNGPGNGDDRGDYLAVDRDGNVYVTGYSIGSATSRDYATIKYDPDGNQVWVTRYNGPGNSDDGAGALALDPSGNVYVTGYSYGSATSYDYATIKYDSEGNQLWVARYNGPANGGDRAHALALDPSGNVYVTGYSYGSGTDWDYGTIKYDSEGNQLWVARYNGSANAGDEAYALTLDPCPGRAGANVYVTGYSHYSGTSSDYATIKYDPEGNELWVARYNGPGNGHDGAYAQALDASGNVYVTGYSYGSGTDYDYATIKYDTDGNKLWLARYNGPGSGDDRAQALALDASGNVYVTGLSYGSGTSSDYATIRYDPEGNKLWVARYKGPGNGHDAAYALALDPSGDVYVTGGSQGSGTDYDYATIKYDAEGNRVRVARYNGPGDSEDRAYALALDPSGNVYVTGYSYGSGTDYDYATIKYSQGPQYYALAVGVSEYDDPFIPDLSYCDDDALGVADTLRHSVTWTDENVYTLVDEDATKGRIRAAVREMVSRAEDDDIVVFYFSGHGAPGGKILPNNAWDFFGYCFNCIKAGELFSWLEPHSGPKLIILDSCFSGDFKNHVKGLTSLADHPFSQVDVISKKEMSSDTLNSLEAIFGPLPEELKLDNVIILSASRANEVSWEYSSLQHGLYTYYLLKEWGEGPYDPDGDGFIDTKETHNYCRYWVPRYNSEQHPTSYNKGIELVEMLSLEDDPEPLYLRASEELARFGDEAHVPQVEEATFSSVCLPNPFNTQANISYSIVNPSWVRLEVFDILGRKVATLVDSEQPASEHSVVWDASEQASGVYFYKLTAGDFTEVRRMTLLK